MIQIADPEVTEEVLQSLSDEEKQELIKKHPALAPIFTNWKVGGNLNLDGCTNLTCLPEGLKVGGNLWLEGCTNLPYKKESDLPCKKGIKGEVFWK